MTPKVATARSGLAEDHLQRLFASLRCGPVSLKQRQVIALAGAWYRGFVGNLEDDPGPVEMWERFQRSFSPEVVLELKHPPRALMIDPDTFFLRNAMAEFVDQVLAEHAIPEVDLESRDQLSMGMWQAIQNAATTLERRARGDYGPDDVLRRFPALEPIGAITAEPAPVTPPRVARAKASTVSRPNHGWRHLFMTLCREHQVAEEARYFIVGHTRRDTGQRHGEASAAALLRELTKLPAFEVE
ncbi:hypothetical protein V5F53_02650 [Xanthobacter sp. V4C-4]|uniref:hypothetical protein n=1 Tax=Xanthobacter cornucopiae TaxID=3119924 RepID=UPI00372BBA24